MTELNAYLIDMGYYPKGRCACKGKPFRWSSKDGYEVRLYSDETWQLRHSDQTLRYGHIQTAIDEIQDYYQKLLGQD